MKKMMMTCMLFLTLLTGCSKNEVDIFQKIPTQRYLYGMLVEFVEDHSPNKSSGFYKIDYSSFQQNSSMNDSSFEVIPVGIVDGMNVKYVKDKIENSRALGFYLFTDQGGAIIPSGNMMYAKEKVIGTIDVKSAKNNLFELSKMSDEELAVLAISIEKMQKARAMK